MGDGTKLPRWMGVLLVVTTSRHVCGHENFALGTCKSCCQFALLEFSGCTMSRQHKNNIKCLPLGIRKGQQPLLVAFGNLQIQCVAMVGCMWLVLIGFLLAVLWIHVSWT